MESFEHDSCLRGYHVYQTIWSAVVGESLTCRRELLNLRDRYSVAVLKDDVTIGHLPAKVSRICSIFL